MCEAHRSVDPRAGCISGPFSKGPFCPPQRTARRVLFFFIFFLILLKLLPKQTVPKSGQLTSPRAHATLSREMGFGHLRAKVLTSKEFALRARLKPVHRRSVGRRLIPGNAPETLSLCVMCNTPHDRIERQTKFEQDNLLCEACFARLHQIARYFDIVIEEWEDLLIAQHKVDEIKAILHCTDEKAVEILQFIGYTKKEMICIKRR